MSNTLAAQAMMGQGADDRSRQELQAKLNNLGGLNGRKLSPEAKQKKLREACEGFESVFIQKMWQEMRNTLPKEGLMHSREEKFWQDMYDQELSKHMTKAGGIGLADMMYEQLSQNLVSASRGSVGNSQFKAFNPEAAPLVSQNNQIQKDDLKVSHKDAEKPISNNKKQLMHDIYSGPVPSQKQEEIAEITQIDNQIDKVEEELTNPEIEKALAALRQEQIITSFDSDQAVTDKKHKKNQGSIVSGLDLSRQAQRDAGDKLGPGAVRPPSKPTSRSVRYSTNMPKNKRTNPNDIIRTLNVDGVSQNSKAGQGLAAYHAQQADHKVGDVDKASIPPLTINDINS